MCLTCAWLDVMCCSVLLQCCSVLQCVVAVLQCVAVCCCSSAWLDVMRLTWLIHMRHDSFMRLTGAWLDTRWVMSHRVTRWVMSHMTQVKHLSCAWRVLDFYGTWLTLWDMTHSMGHDSLYGTWLTLWDMTHSMGHDKHLSCAWRVLDLRQDESCPIEWVMSHRVSHVP